jgi:hypothetical protein
MNLGLAPSEHILRRHIAEGAMQSHPLRTIVPDHSCSSEDNEMVSPDRLVTVEQIRTHLLRLAPELQDMAESLPRNNPDYERIVTTPVRLINFLCRRWQHLTDVDNICKGYIKFDSSEKIMGKLGLR